MKKRLTLLTLFVALILVCSFCLSSCAFLMHLRQSREEIPNGDGDEIVGEENGGESNNGGTFDGIDGADDVIQSGGDDTNSTNKDEGGKEENGGNTTIVIEGESADVAYAATAGLRSSVSVLAKHGTSGAASGSGVIFELDASSGSAFIITNYHVVYYNGSISSDLSVYLYGMQYTDYAISATYVGGSPNFDIAVLRVDNSSLLKSSAAKGTVAAVSIADSDALTVGSTAIAIGAPGVDDTSYISSIAVTSGIVSVDSEYITMTSVNGVSEVEFRVIRIDTAVNSGNSGGGLFNAKGELIGVVNAKISKTDVENIAYAIPSSLVNAVAKNIIDYCYGKDCKSVMRPIMGVTVNRSNIYTEYDKSTGYIRPCEDISVVETTAGSLADGALKAGDIIKSVKIGDIEVEVKRMHHLIDTMLYARVGDEVITTVSRGGQKVEVKIVITEASLTEY